MSDMDEMNTQARDMVLAKIIKPDIHVAKWLLRRPVVNAVLSYVMNGESPCDVRYNEAFSFLVAAVSEPDTWLVPFDHYKLTHGDGFLEANKSVIPYIEDVLEVLDPWFAAKFVFEETLGTGQMSLKFVP